MKSGFRYLVLALSLSLLVGCSEQSFDDMNNSQGPTGSALLPNVRESYLIPPEIPSTLLDHLFTTSSIDGEITSIELKDFTDDIWSLEITFERLPDESHSELKRYRRIGDTWIRL